MPCGLLDNDRLVDEFQEANEPAPLQKIPREPKVAETKLDQRHPARVEMVSRMEIGV